MYLQLGYRGRQLLGSADPHIWIRFPKWEDAKPASKQANARKSNPGEGEWLSAKPKAKKRKKLTAATKKAPKKGKGPAKKRGASFKKKENRSTENDGPAEVIDLFSDDDDDDELDDEPIATIVRQAKSKSPGEALWKEDEEFEFDE